MNSDLEKSELILCLGRLKDNYLALHILISNTLNLQNTKQITTLSDEENKDFWRIQISILVEQVVLTHCKLIEVKERYAKLIPEDHRKTLNKKFPGQKIVALRTFRNKCSGHLLDKKTKGPLDTNALQSLISRSFGENDVVNNIVPSFFNKDNPSDPDSLVNIVEAIISELGSNKK